MTTVPPTAPPSPAAPPSANVARIKLLSINDFHGQLIDSELSSNGIEIGGAATLSAYAQRERAENPGGTMLVSAGDLVGAAPPVSTLLRHQSTMAVLAAMGVELSTLGNHEFDGGFSEAMRLIYGDGPLAEAARAAQGLPKAKRKRGATQAAADARAGWPGSAFPWVSANIVDVKTKRRVLPPYAIKTLNGVKVALVGVVTKDLKNVTSAAGIPNIEATDPAAAVNALVPELRAKGVRTIVVVAHEGAKPDEKNGGALGGDLVELMKGLDPEVDAVVSGHSHKEYATKVDGRPVVQAGSYAAALGVLELDVDRTTGDVVGSNARLVKNDEHGIAPDPVVAKMVAAFQAKVAPKTERVVANLSAPLTKEQAPSGESTMGAVIAEAQRAYTKADVGLMNIGGVRADLKPGPVKWGQLFSVQPFGNRVNTLELTGEQLKAALEEQFTAARTNILQVAGIKVHLDTTRPIGSRVVSVTMADGTPLDPKKSYKVAINGFVVDGGDGYTTFKKGRNRKDVCDDLTALVAWFERGGKPDGKLPGRQVLDAGTIELGH